MINRRTFLQMSGLAGFSALGVASKNAAAEADARPNILWLSTEDISPHLGCYGDPHAITPTLDRLAAEGVLFNHAYASAPVCAPNRSCVISGVYAATLGSLHMRSGWHSGGRNTMPVPPPDLSFLPEVLRSAGYYCTNNSKEDYNLAINRKIWDESSNKAHWRHRPNADQPFFAVFNFTDTHESMVRATPERVARATEMLQDTQRQQPEGLELPPYHVDAPDTRRNWANYHELITALDYWVAGLLHQLEEDSLAGNTIVIFWSDHGVGMPRGKRWLYDSGIHIPMIAYAPEAWRDYAGVRPGTQEDRLVSCLDLAPTTLALAGVPIPNTMQGKPFLGKELPPESDYVFATRDRMDERYDTIRMVRDKRYKYIRNFQPFLPYHQFLSYNEQSPVQQDLNRSEAAGTLPPGAHWMTGTGKPVEELYDTEVDPHEIRNIAEHPESLPTLKRMRAVLEARMEEVGDLGLLPESELDRLGKRYGFRCVLRKEHEAAHPGFWRQLHETAIRAGKPQEGDEAALLAAFDSTHPAMRWWAVIGLRQILNRSEAGQEALHRALKDDAMLVATAAAHSLLRQEGMHDAALELLTNALLDPDEWIQIQAALALDDIGEKALPAVPLLEQALNNADNKYVARIACHALNMLLGTNCEVQ